MSSTFGPDRLRYAIIPTDRVFEENQVAARMETRRGDHLATAEQAPNQVHVCPVAATSLGQMSRRKRVILEPAQRPWESSVAEILVGRGLVGGGEGGRSIMSPMIGVDRDSPSFKPHLPAAAASQTSYATDHHDAARSTAACAAKSHAAELDRIRRLGSTADHSLQGSLRCCMAVLQPSRYD
ncbi:uncharacterized protein N7482_008977 [Penicillium canariense]|uniref:Uncharacterized protein n=1 Tax=Penicillium canariense TaxID=189055 RepID=A0A9W9HUV2_9EURO|nr:uncharacterized protein N7482_008977 [Penicillium canariense]KAJ5157877.1 hypothetical protein N7482_008977 [Penicillium canariense]